MNFERFNDIVETYGTQARNWPEDDRQACLDLLANSGQANKLLEQYRELDALLDQIPVPAFPNLEQRVLLQPLPAKKPSGFDVFLEWLIPEDLGLSLWRPMTAACLPLVVGIVVGNYFSFGVSEQDISLEYWDDELALLSFNDLTPEISGIEAP